MVLKFKAKKQELNKIQWRCCRAKVFSKRASNKYKANDKSVWKR